MKKAFYVHPLGYVTAEHPLCTSTFIAELQMTLLLSWISYNSISQERRQTCAEGLIHACLVSPHFVLETMRVTVACVQRKEKKKACRSVIPQA